MEGKDPKEAEEMAKAAAPNGQKEEHGLDGRI